MGGARLRVCTARQRGGAPRPARCTRGHPERGHRAAKDLPEAHGEATSDEALTGEALTGEALLVLQFPGRGYPPEQIAALRGWELAEVLWHLQRAVGQLGAATPGFAIAEARRRGLID